MVSTLQSKWHRSSGILRGSKEVLKPCPCTILGHIPSELNERHPAIYRYIHSPNDFDMALRDTVLPDSPSVIGQAIRRVLLKEALDS